MATNLRLRLLAVTATAGALALAACGTDDSARVAQPAVDPVAETVEVTLVDYAFEGLPDQVPAGTRLTVVNEAPSELHELVAFRLSDDEERSLDELATLSPVELEGALGAPATVLLAAPGGDPIPAVGDGTLDEAGRYAVMCFIPTGVEPEVYLEAAAEAEEGPPEVEGGPPHLVHGMIAELVVEG